MNILEDDFNYLMTDCHNYHLKSKQQSKKVSSHQQTVISQDTDSIEKYKDTIDNHFITVKSVGKIELIDCSQVIWLHASSNYIEIYLNERTILHRESLTKLEKKFTNNQFIRVHRSSIINLNKVKSIESERGRYDSITLVNGHNVKLSNAYRAHLFSQLGIENSK